MCVQNAVMYDLVWALLDMQFPPLVVEFRLEPRSSGIKLWTLPTLPVISCLSLL